jgi:hypothetical protein
MAYWRARDAITAQPQAAVGLGGRGRPTDQSKRFWRTFDRAVVIAFKAPRDVSPFTGMNPVRNISADKEKRLETPREHAHVPEASYRERHRRQ